MYRKSAKPVEPVVEYTVEQIWGAAAYAFRINKEEYLREDIRSPDTGEIIRHSNKSLVWQQAKKEFADVTDADRELGATVLLWLKGQRMFANLAGNTKLTEFIAALDHLITLEKFSSRDRYYPAIAASQFKAYTHYQLEQAMREDTDRSPLADVGEKVDTQITVLRSVFSQQWNVFFVTAKTSSQHMVFFSYKKPLEPNSQHHIKGTVKAHRPDSTQLNRVKVI